MSAIRVTITRTAGSVPREAGTQMLIWEDRTKGTIGGGALEWEAMAQARRMLSKDEPVADLSLPLGPSLGQCCGGSVTLRFEQADTLSPPKTTPVWIWGAGHVGRAIAATLAPLPQMDVTLIDDAPARMADIAGTTPLVAADMPRAVPHAPQHAHHLILTYSHEIDLALCHVLLRHGFASAGLIGSATKWARFRKRLHDLGHSDAVIHKICCPIGDPSLGKHPQAIALGVASALVKTTNGGRNDATALADQRSDQDLSEGHSER